MELEHQCAAIFPDFYWTSSERDNAFDLGDADQALYFPCANKAHPDDRITAERDAALRALGFTHCMDQRLGLIGADER